MCTGAQAQSPGTALIVRTPGDDALVVPLRAELNSYRFRVLELADRNVSRNRPLAALAAQYDAQAALRTVSDEIAVELWLAPNDPAGTASDEVVRAGTTRDPNLLALRITELMRARGLRLPTPAPPSAAPVLVTKPVPEATPVAAAPAPAPPPAREEQPAARDEPPSTRPTPQPEPERRRASVTAPAEPVEAPDSPAPAHDWLQGEAALASVFSPGAPGLAPTLDVFAQLRVSPLRLLSFSLFGVFPLWRPALERADRGSVDVSMFALGGAADLQLELLPPAFLLSVGLGAASLLTTVTGEATPGAAVRSEKKGLRTAALFVRAGLGYELTHAIHLSARVLAGYALPALRIAFGDSAPATWGRPLLAITLGIEVVSPWP